jgi:hypothetical protein
MCTFANTQQMIFTRVCVHLQPPPVVQHFIADVERSAKYTGFPALGVEWQKVKHLFPDLGSSGTREILLRSETFAHFAKSLLTSALAIEHVLTWCELTNYKGGACSARYFCIV